MERLKPINAGEHSYLNRRIVVTGTLLLTAIIMGAIFLLTNTSTKTKFSYIDVVVANSTGLPTEVYYKNSQVLILSGWESNLEYENTVDRLAGNEEYKKIVFDEKAKPYTLIVSDDQLVIELLTTNPEKAKKIGWFTKTTQYAINEEKSWNRKKVNVELNEGDIGIKKAEIKYNLYKDKPYFKASFSAEVENPLNLSEFAYGITAGNYDIYLPTGTRLKNDNKVEKLNKPVGIVLREGNKTVEIPEELKEAVKGLETSKTTTSRTGSNYEQKAKYEIFYNPEKKLGIILYSPNTLYFKNSFYWNVHWVYTSYNDGYPPLYFIVLESPGMKYENGDWQITTKNYQGSAKSYIDQAVKEMENEG